MALIRDIAIGMSVNPAGLNRGLKSAEMALSRFGSAATSVRGVIVGLGAGLAISSAVNAIKDMAFSGANLNATLSKTGIVFGKSASVITDEAEKVADTVGAVKSEFIDAATSFGAMFKGAGQSQEDAAKLGVSLTKLGMDMASFEGGAVSNKDVFTAISSALRGEFDPIERFRVFLSADKIAAEALASGLAKTKGELTDFAKKQATLNLILRQTKDAQGDLARTFGDSDNQIKAFGGRWQNLKDEAGLAMKPITESVSRLANSILVELTDALSGNKEAFAAWAKEAGAAGGGVAGAFDKVGQSAVTAVEAIHVGRLAWTGFAAAGQTAIAGLVGLIADMTEAVNSFMTSITGKKYDSTFIRAWADELKATAQQSTKDFNDLKAAGSGADKLAAVLAKARAGAGAGAGGGAVVKAAVPPPAVAQDAKTAKGVDDLVKSLRTEIDTFNMAGKSAEIYKLKLAGASDEQLKLVRSLDAQLQGKQLMEQFESPAAKLEKERARLQGLFDAGGIDKATFGKGMAAAREGLGASGPRFAGAVTSGSTEAYSAQLKFATRDTAKDEPAKQTAKNTEKQVDILGQINAGINRLVERQLNRMAIQQVAETYFL